MRDERGQVLPLTVLALGLCLIGLVGLVVDVGSWYEAQRKAQSVADAAALAAVQKLPGDTADAVALAEQYAAANGGTIDPPAITSTTLPDDTITVTARSTAPAIFSRIFGITSVSVHATASAQAYSAAKVAGVVPLAVNASAPQLQCGAGCFGQTVTLPFGQDADLTRGAFGLMDLENSNGNVTPQTLGNWLSNGYPSPLPLGLYQSSPGNRFHNPSVEGAITSLATQHKTVLLPVYDSVSGSGANEVFDVTGFAAFRVDGFDVSGPDAEVTGAFVQTITHGATGRATQYYGVAWDGLTR